MVNRSYTNGGGRGGYVGGASYASNNSRGQRAPYNGGGGRGRGGRSPYKRPPKPNNNSGSRPPRHASVGEDNDSVVSGMTMDDHGGQQIMPPSGSLSTSCQLFVRDKPPRTDEVHMKDYFNEVLRRHNVHAVVTQSKKGRHNPCLSFVDFESNEQATTALKFFAANRPFVYRGYTLDIRRPNQYIGPPSTTIFVGRVPVDEITDLELVQFLNIAIQERALNTSPGNPILSVRLSGRKRCAWVEFRSPEEAVNSLKLAEAGLMIGGSELPLTFEQRKEEDEVDSVAAEPARSSAQANGELAHAQQRLAAVEAELKRANSLLSSQHENDQNDVNDAGGGGSEARKMYESLAKISEELVTERQAKRVLEGVQQQQKLEHEQQIEALKQEMAAREEQYRTDLAVEQLKRKAFEEQVKALQRELEALRGAKPRNGESSAGNDSPTQQSPSTGETTSDKKDSASAHNSHSEGMDAGSDHGQHHPHSLESMKASGGMNDRLETELDFIISTFDEEEILIEHYKLSRFLMVQVESNKSIKVQLILHLPKGYPDEGISKVEAIVAGGQLTQMASLKPANQKKLKESLPSLAEACRLEAEHCGGSEALYFVLTAADSWANEKWAI